ncbi:MAG: D-tyrosyl-tRNA(Tyr) deacylase [Ruminococcaceae bacterium]|nr:D-tyrosyl-tRNA(Tyr) deacylase [Oscillospiraceae bacterium]
MRAVIQRVSRASVSVDGEIIGACGVGFLILLGVAKGDTEEDVTVLAAKIAKLRIFEDENGKMNRSLADVGGELLVISNFTLLADCRHGNRPDYLAAEAPGRAKELYELFAQTVASLADCHTETGRFGADMAVSLVNDGPVTIVLESADLKRRKG